MSSTSTANTVEKRPLKRPRLGPPDFYPQDPKQKEDELSPEKLKAGYVNNALPSEYDSAKTAKIEDRLDDFVSKVTNSLNGIFTKKQDLNTWQDRDKKKLGNKEITFWHASAKPKDKDLWFRDLAGNKPLTALAKRFPIFNKKEEIFSILCDFNIPMCRAAWFIKMTAAYYTMQQESGKMKRKQQNDPCSDWTANMTRFLKDLLSKVSDYYTLNSQSIMNCDVDLALKQWNYCSRLARFMFEEGLLERQEFLMWLLDVFYEKSFRTEYFGVLKLFLPFLLQFVEGITRSESLSRRMMFICCRKLYQLYIDLDTTSIPCNPGVNRVPSPLSCYKEYLQCGYHRHVVISLSALIHAVMLECPTALVWNFLGDSSPSGSLGDSKYGYLCGSPLDSLPCAPSVLPIPEGPSRDLIKCVLRASEKDIIRRSQAVEARWSSDKCQQSGLGTIVPSMLRMLEAFDKRRLDESQSIDKLYDQIFLPDCNDSEEGGESTIIKLLCHWAVTTQRVGSHRALVVVRLLEKRKMDAHSEPQANMDIGWTNYPFQQFLYEYLDTEAPSLKHEAIGWNLEFFNLVLLFSEMIRADLFSHDQYLCSLISRGELNTAVPVFDQQQSKMPQKNVEVHDFSDIPEEPRVDLDKVLASIADDRPIGSGFDHTPLSTGSSAPGSVDIQPSSVESSSVEGLATTTVAGSSLPLGNLGGKPSSCLLSSANSLNTGNIGKLEEKLSRHQLYVMHFPVPQDEQYRHECNQRQTLLFGVGTAREAQKGAIKKMTKDVNKMWQKMNKIWLKKSNCTECLSKGDIKIKKKMSRDDLNSLTSKFSVLSLYDQHVVLGICTDSFIEQLKDFISRDSQLLPSPESMDYLLKLMEMGAYMFGFIDFVDEIVELLPKVEVELKSRKCQLAGVYGFQIAFCFIGYLRRHYAYFLLCQEEVENVLNQLLALVEVTQGAGKPCLMNSWERAVVVFLGGLIQSCPDLIGDNSGKYAKFDERLKRAQPLRVESPSAANGHYHQNFAKEQLESSKRKLDIGMVDMMNRDDKEGADRRYSFVVNSLLAVIGCSQEREKLADLCTFCADATTACPSLVSEWLGLFKALCCSSAASSGFINQDIGFSDLLLQVEVTDGSVHGPISTFVMSLVARHCVHLEDLVLHVTSPSLFALCLNTSARIGNDIEAEARLSLMILAAVLCLTEDWGCVQVRLTAERYLLCAAHDSCVAQGVLTVLIAMLLLADSDAVGKGNSSTSESELNAADQFKSKSEDGSLQNFASRVLEVICSQEWISRKFLYQADLFTEKLLLNKKVKPEQAQKLLRLITRRSCEKDLVAELDNCGSKRNLIAKLLSSLNIWNLRTAMLELQLLLKQANPSECSQVVDLIARSCMDLFHSHSVSGMVNNSAVQLSSSLGGAAGQQNNSFHVADVSNYWLIAPLISRLPSNVQGKVLKAAASVLETGQIGRKEKGAGGSQQSAWLLGQQPFLCLVLTCLNGQEDQREGLLNSLLKQLQDYVHRAKEDPVLFCQREVAVETTEALQLRLSLVGGMFETVCKAQNIETWSLLFLQLMLYNVVFADLNSTLFNTCLDMLTVCIHSCLVPEACGSLAPERTSEECRKLYSTVIKKLKREIADKYIPALKPVYHLLPIPKAQVDIITCEPYGAQPPPKVVKGAPPPPPAPVAASSRQGLKVSEKIRVSPWDLVEGWKGWNWTWFQALKVDCQAENAQAHLGRLLHHEHYHKFPRPPLPGVEQHDPYLEPLQVEIDQEMLHRTQRQKEGLPQMPQHMVSQPPAQIPGPSKEMVMRVPMPGPSPQQHMPMVAPQMMMPQVPVVSQMVQQDFVPQAEQPAPICSRGGSKGKRKSAGGRTGGRKNSKGSSTPPVASSLPQQIQRPPSDLSFAGPPAYPTLPNPGQPPSQWIAAPKYTPQNQPPSANAQSGREALRNLIGNRYAGPGYGVNARSGPGEGFSTGPSAPNLSTHQQAQMGHMQVRQHITQQLEQQQQQQQQNIVRSGSIQRQPSSQIPLSQSYVGVGQTVQISSADGTVYTGRPQVPGQQIYVTQDAYPPSGQGQEQMMNIGRQRMMQQQNPAAMSMASMNPRLGVTVSAQQQMPVSFAQVYHPQRMPTQYSMATGPQMSQDPMFSSYQ